MEEEIKKCTNYPPELKEAAIELYEEQGLPYKIIMLRLGIKSKTSLMDWVREFRKGKRDFSVNKHKEHLTYPAEVKLEAARLHEEDGLTYNQIMCKLGIVTKSKLKEWIYLYRKGERNFTDRRGMNSGRTKKNLTESDGRMDTNQQLEARIKRLEMENDLLKKALAGLRR